MGDENDSIYLRKNKGSRRYVGTNHLQNYGYMYIKARHDRDLNVMI